MIARMKIITTKGGQGKLGRLRQLQKKRGGQSSCFLREAFVRENIKDWYLGFDKIQSM